MKIYKLLINEMHGLIEEKKMNKKMIMRKIMMTKVRAMMMMKELTVKKIKTILKLMKMAVNQKISTVT